MMALLTASLTRLHLPSASQYKAGLFSVGLLAFSLATLWLGGWMSTALPDKVLVREISLLAPPTPPPPPPQTVHQPMAEASLRLQVQGVGPKLSVLEIDQPVIEVSKPDIPRIETIQTQWQSLEIEWDAFTLDDLDSLPALLTPVRAVIPKSLERRGIDNILIKLDVLIDEQGQVTLISVVENAYPELASEIQKIVRASRFTAPQKGNAPVRARFIWPIEITL